MFLAGFDLNEDSTTSSPEIFNDTLGTNLTHAAVHTVELMGMQCNKECYAISVAAAVTFLAGVYQVKKKNNDPEAQRIKYQVQKSELYQT